MIILQFLVLTFLVTRERIKMNWFVSKMCPIFKPKIIITSILLSCSNNVYSGDSATSKIIKSDPMSGSYLLQLIMGLLVVLLCIIALAWFSKKINRFQSITDDSLQIVAGLSMGARERVVLLQVGEEQILIGVSPGKINMLHVLNKPVEFLKNSAVGSDFSDKLKSMMTSASNSSVAQRKKK